MAFTFYLGHRLARSEIGSLSKGFILCKFHKYIRLWFIEGVLPDSLLEDPEIVPYYTPCKGHIETKPEAVSSSHTTDEIDGVLPMQAYCSQCKNDLR